MDEKAKITVFRYSETMRNPEYRTYEVPKEKGLTVLQALFMIKDLYDDAPAFRRYQCNRGQCCSCLMTIDGEIKRACTTAVEDDMLLEPLQDYPIIRDLIVDFGRLVDGKLIRWGTMIQWPKTVWKIDRKAKSALIYREENCTGCGLCREVCPVNQHENLSDRYGTTLKPPVLYLGDGEKVNLKGVCPQCTNAPCMHFCPAKVIRRDEKTGAICVEEEFCLGCGMCLEACPNEALFLDKGRGKAVKCDLCGGKPLCVESCPSEALLMSFL